MGAIGSKGRMNCEDGGPTLIFDCERADQGLQFANPHFFTGDVMKTAKALSSVLAGSVLIFCAAGGLGQDWPQWRGPNRDNKVTGFKAPSAWPKELTKKWRVEVGIGESSPLLVGDKIYVFGRQGGDEVTLCLNAANGMEIW